MWLLVFAGSGIFPGCGGTPKPPKRGVIESDVGGWGFRRFQHVLDVEVWVKKNKAEAFAASYVRNAAEKSGSLERDDVRSALVTRYTRSKGVRKALVIFARRLSGQRGYQVSERVLGGVRVYEMKGPGEYWLMWASKKYLVKLGGQGSVSVPGDLIEAYARRYPSGLKAGELEGELVEDNAPSVAPEAFDPSNPTPQWQ